MFEMMVGVVKTIFVTDTPASYGANYGCPSYPTVNCSSTNMTMNYMVYPDDAYMFMFTNGQRNRMRTIFTSRKLE